MTAQGPIISASAAMHLARSQVVDAFGGVEQAVAEILLAAGEKVTSQPLGHKLAAVKKLSPSPRYSKQRCQEVHAAIDQLQPLLCLRAEIVHSTMLDVRIGNTPEIAAGFANPSTQPPVGRALTVYTRDELRALAEKVTVIARDLNG